MADNPYGIQNPLSPVKGPFTALAQPIIKQNAATPGQTTTVQAPGVPATPVLQTPAPMQKPAAPQVGPAQGVSIVDYLKSTGQASDYASRANLATQYGMQGYSGTAEQNTQLLGSLRGGSPTQGAPVVPNVQQPGTVQTPSGTVVNPATGGVITAPGTPAIPKSPLASEPFSSPEYEAAAKEVSTNLQPSAEEVSAAEELNKINESLRQGYIGEGDRPIALPFITGRQKSLETRAATLSEPIQAKAALAQAKRTAALDASKFKLETESTRLAAYREANKPVSVTAGTALINPLTGKTVAEGQSLSEKQALDTFYNIAQTYPDARITWDDAKTAQQNLSAAQKSAAGSPSFQAKNTIYAINPLTGQPQIISKMGGGGGYSTEGSGGGTVFGGSTTQSVSTANLAPELRSALSDVNGVQFFDQSKVTSGQLPYLQRAAQEMNIPLLAKEDVNKIQEALGSFKSASALVDQISNLTSSVLTASDTPGSQVAQLARLKAIELAPALSTDNNAKQFISARNSVLSLLTRAAGEKGALTDQDVKRIADALPSYSDSASLAAQKAANFSNVLGSVLQGAVGAYIGAHSTGGGSSSPATTTGGRTGKTSSGIGYTIIP
jgi:hypothetical protein